MKIEVASTGEFRAQSGRRIYSLVDGVDYSIIENYRSKPSVMKVDDIRPAMREFAAAAGITNDIPPISIVPGPEIVRGSEMTVKGRSGTAYYIKRRSGRISSEPIAIISQDSTLLPIGQAIARQYERAELLIDAQEVRWPSTPIMLAGAELQWVHFDAIPKSQFIVPAQPISRAQITQMILRGH